MRPRLQKLLIALVFIVASLAALAWLSPRVIDGSGSTVRVRNEMTAALEDLEIHAGVQRTSIGTVRRGDEATRLVRPGGWESELRLFYRFDKFTYGVNAGPLSGHSENLVVTFRDGQCEIQSGMYTRQVMPVRTASVATSSAVPVR